MMKVFNFVLGSCFAAAAVFAAENPVCTLYPSDIRFYASFNDSTMEPDLASGDAVPTLVQGPPEFTEGVSGKGLALGRAFFRAPRNFELKTPGSVIFWVSPVNWPDKAAKEPGFTAFSGWTVKRAEVLTAGKSVNQPWGKSGLNAYMQFPKNHVNCSLMFKGNAKDWKNGRWHMLVLTWRPAGFSYSVDGGKSQFSYLKTPVGTDSEGFYFGISGKKEPCTVAMDEFVILGRALSDDEIAKLYEESRKAFQVK